jgi:hypothetical protein
MDWVIRWVAPLMPDPESVPGSEVFQDSTQQYSLTANAAGVPGLLFPAPDLLLQGVHQAISQTHSHTTSRTNKQTTFKRKKSQRKKAQQHS